MKTVFVCYVLSIEKHSYINKKYNFVDGRFGKIFLSSDLFWAAERSSDKSAV